MTVGDIIQATFNKIIEAGYYPGHTIFMCDAIKLAKREKLISPIDAAITLSAIRHYIYPFHTLETALNEKRIANNINTRLNVYLDWANRPYWSN